MAGEHLSFEQLLAFAEERFTAEGQEGTREHLARCPACAAAMDRVAGLVAGLRADAEGPPAHARAMVRGLFQAARPAAPLHIIATPRFDSRGTAAFGLRAGLADERQMLFDADPYAIDLRMRGENARWIVAGQILGPATPGAVHLHGPSGSLRAELNEVAEFAFTPAPPGQYTLVVMMATASLIIPGLDVGA